MSAPSSTAGKTRIFGIPLAVDPKILVAGLIALAALIFWSNTRSDEEEIRPSGAPRASASNSSTPVSRPRPVSRLRGQNERATLRLRPVEGTRGDVDPTLRLDLLDRVRAVAPETGLRNLFEGGVAAAANLPPIPKGPTLVPKPVALQGGPAAIPSTSMNLAVHIPFKYYGFARSSTKGDPNRGFFMNGDNVLMGAEGEVLEQRYLIVALTPNTAKVEDTQLKQGQDLPVTPEAVAQ